MKENKSLKDISEYQKQIKYIEEKSIFLKKEIPDIQVRLHLNEISFKPRFASKSVNQNYTGLDFHKKYDTLSVSPFRELNFNYEGVDETIKVFSNPGTSRLIYIIRKYDSSGNRLKYILNFSKMAINFQNNNFNESMLNTCRLEILNFMKKYPNHTLNTKHLDPKLKNLMAFT